MNRGRWRVWVFGGGTALPSVQRDNTFLALDLGGACWLIDCAGSPYRKLLQAGLDPLRLRGVLLTHAHADHIYGLPALLFQLALAGYEDRLLIYGLGDTLGVAQRVVEAFALGSYCASHEWQVMQLRHGGLTSVPVDDDISLQVGEVCHSRPAVGVRIEGSDGQVVAYSGDSEPCKGLIILAQGATWLLHECTVDRPLSGHSTPEDVARVAQEAGIQNLGIVHYDPAYVVTLDEARRRICAAGFGGRVRLLEDMDVVP